MTEKKGVNISYSAVDTYLSCSEKFRLERLEKIVPEEIKTPLFFGKACDTASEIIFKDKMKDSGVKYSRDEVLKVLKKELEFIDWQGETISIADYHKVRYSKTDIDSSLLEKEDIKIIREYIDKKGLELDNVYEYVEYCKEKKNPAQDELELYNFICHHILYRKAILLLDALKAWTDANVIEVISVQKFFEIKNEDGDILRGLIDLEAILKDSPNEVTTLDLKTARNPKQSYPDDVIQTAKQLHIYSEFSNERVGYVILDKDVKKKEPRVRIRELYGRVTEKHKDDVFGLIDTALQGIKAEKFEKNLDACWQFGKCPFYNFCRTGDRQGLVPRITKKDLEEAKKNKEKTITS